MEVVAQHMVTGLTDREHRKQGTVSNPLVTLLMFPPGCFTHSSLKNRLGLRAGILQVKTPTPPEVLGSAMGKAVRDPLEDRLVTIRCWHPLPRHNRYRMDITPAKTASCSKRRIPLLSYQGCRCGCPMLVL